MNKMGKHYQIKLNNSYRCKNKMNWYRGFRIFQIRMDKI